MKMPRAWMRVTAAAATTIATFGGELAVGQNQYGPYASAPQPGGAPQYGAAQYGAAPQYTQYPPVAPYGMQPTQPAQTPTYPTTAPVTSYSVAAAPQYPAVPQMAAAPQTVYAPAPPQQQPQQQPAYVAALPHYANSVAKQQEAPRYQPPQYQRAGMQPSYPTLAQNPSDTVTPGSSTPGSPTPGTPTPVMTPPQGAENLPAPAPGSNGDIAQGYNAPYPSTNGYMSSDPGCNNGGYGEGYGALDGCDECDGGSQWFGGVYGLYMTRSQPSYRRYTVGVDTAATGTPYFPARSDTENMSDCTYLVPDWREGVEVRLGATFGIGDSCDYGDCDSGCGGYGTGGYGNACGGDACGCEPCQPCCQQMYAWEVAWWGIDRDVQEQFVDGPVINDFRYYGMVNYAGLQYDDGGGAQPVNDFYNYQIPITGVGTETVIAQRVRTNFSCQNLELNFLRLPMLMAGGGACGYDCCAPAFSLTGLCGFRYFRFDDDFEFGTEWASGGQTVADGWGNGTNELFHDIQMENQLVGFQLGANMNYTVATRWNAFWDTNFGIYNNNIDQFQRMYNPLLGAATFEQDGSEATINSSKNEVAFLGEMRLGGGYLFSPRWRGILAYRAIAMTGVALAPDQIKPEYSNFADTAIINADGSLIVHGVQAGIECNY